MQAGLTKRVMKIEDIAIMSEIQASMKKCTYKKLNKI